MATEEKEVLIVIDIDTESAIKDTEKARKAVNELKKGLKELTDAEKANNKSIDEQNKKLKELQSAKKKDLSAIAQTQSKITGLLEKRDDLNKSIVKQTDVLKVNQAELRSNQRVSQNIIKTKKEEKGSVNQLRAELGKVTAKWNALSEKERENTKLGKSITKQKKDLTNQLKKLEKATGDNRRNVGNYSSALKGLGANLLAGAGLTVGLSAAMNGLKSIIASTAEGQIFLAKVSGATNAIMSTFRDSIVSAFNGLKDFFGGIESFSDLLSKLGDKISNFYKVRLAGFNKFISAGAKLLKGEYKDALTDVGDGFAQVAFGVEDATAKSKDFIDKLKIMADFGAAIAEGEKKLELQRSKFAIREAKDLRKIADLRAIAADKNGKSIEERRKALNRALALERGLSSEREGFNKKELDFQNALFKAHNSNIDDEIKLNVIKKKADEESAASLKKQKAIISELSALEKEAAAAKIKLQKEANKKAEAERLDQLRQQAEADAQILQDRLDKTKEFHDAETQLALSREQIDLENNKKHIFAKLADEKIGLEVKHQQEIEAYKKLGADTTKLDEYYKKKEQEIDKASFDAKLILAGNFAGNIAQIAGEGTAIGKAAAVAQTTISTYQAATGAYASLAAIPIVGPALGIAAAGAAIASGLANVRKILSVKSGLPGDVGGSASGISTSGGGTAATPTRALGAAPTLNQGIVSRVTNVSTKDKIEVQPTLVTDQVTVNQSREKSNKETAVI